MRLHSKNLGSAKEGMLKLSHLGTHEKVLIPRRGTLYEYQLQLSKLYRGDGRRESGTIQRGGVADLREKFIHAIASAPFSSRTPLVHKLYIVDHRKLVAGGVENE
jgi:hypothetical protein